MATLTNTKIKDTYDGLLKTTDNDVIGASEKVITDGLGNASVLSIGTASASFSSDIEINGLTIGKGNGNLSTNVAVGVNALDSVTYGVDNTAIGHSTMQNLTGGVDNAAFGTGAMVSTTTGSYNTSIGSASLPVNTTGQSNTAVGLQAMQVNTTGGANTVVGMNALNDNTEGNRNTTLGFGSGNGIITGSDNIHIGYNTTSGATDVSNEIVIGSNATGNGSNTATYGDSNITDHYFTSGTVRINSDSLRLTGATNPQVLVTDTTNSVSVGLQALDASTKIDSTHSFKIEIGNDIIQSVTSSGVEITGNLAVDTNTLYVDAANNRVGVGTSSPDRDLDVVNSSSNSIVSIVSSDSAVAALVLGDSSDDDAGGILYNNISDYLYFQANGSERMRIDSSGNVQLQTVNAQLRFQNSVGPAPFIANAGSGDQDLYISTGGSESMRIDSSGNVGIGTTPSYKLHTLLAAGSSNGVGLLNTSGQGLKIYTDSTASNADVYIEQGATGAAMIFRQTTSERMRIDSSGNVGIGTQSADDLLHLQGSEAVVGATQLTLEGRYEGYSAGINFVSRTSNEGTRVSMAKITADGEDSWSTTASTQDAGLRFFTTLNGSQSERMRITSSGDVQLVGNTYLYANPSAGSTTIGSGFNLDGSNNLMTLWTNDTERMRITSLGFTKATNFGTYQNVNGSYHELNNNANNEWVLSAGQHHASSPYGILVNYIASAPNNTTNYFFFGTDNSGTAKFYVRSNGGIGNFQSNDVDLSDERTKNSITPIDSTWDKIKGIEVVKYKYNEQTSDDFNIGVIAQQVEEVAPELVSNDGFGGLQGEENDLKSVYNKDLYFTAIKALQEAMNRIETLEAKVAALESQLNA